VTSHLCFKTCTLKKSINHEVIYISVILQILLFKNSLPRKMSISYNFYSTLRIIQCTIVIISLWIIHHYLQEFDVDIFNKFVEGIYRWKFWMKFFTQFLDLTRCSSVKCNWWASGRNRTCGPAIPTYLILALCFFYWHIIFFGIMFRYDNTPFS
jgi:hypothetical protein